MRTKKSTTKQRFLKIVTVSLALAILNDVVYPTAAWALTGGPSQPEVESFTPVGTSDMVDPFSGDFKYNIPLMDVGGYPINISYNSGITMDQEASWVGLGWNINAGVINRSMRGIPDDFNGDPVTKEYNMRPNKTYGMNLGVGVEIAGKSDKWNTGVDYTLGVKYNNYNGIGIEKSLTLSLSAGEDGKSPLNGSLGITSSSDEGLTIQPRVGLSFRMAKLDENTSANLGFSVGAPFNSRGGLKQLSVSTNVSVSAKRNQTDDKNKGRATLFSKAAAANFNFGQSTYTPNVSMPMRNFSITGSFKLGSELMTLHPNGTIGGYYSAQELITNSITNPAFGYMHSDAGSAYDNALHDFNREKDGSFNESTPALPVTNYTYDIYSVSGQGMGGSYRPFRSDIGYVYDAESYTTSDGYSIGGEVGIGNLNHYGLDVSVTNVDSRSGRWRNGNDAASKLKYRSTTSNPLYEKYYFKEANEKSVDSDPSFFTNTADYKAVRFQLNQVSKFNTHADDIYVDRNENAYSMPSANYRSQREKRSQAITVLNNIEMDAHGLEVKPNLYADQGSLPNSVDHHIGEISSLATDGSRYVYGISAYNTRQEETTFAVGADLYNNGGYTGNCVSGLVTYSPSVDNSSSNELGIDNYYSNNIMPAFAHSYLLTAVLSPDYVDSDNTRGPSTGDLGNYTKFNYSKTTNYKWRVPTTLNAATFNEGLKADPQDDKANYLYGEKELWYLESIETKNYIAVFTTTARDDGRGVLDKNGGLETDNTKAMKKLDKISLYVRSEYLANPVTAVPVKEVHFEYDYSLCPGIPNNINNGGKLTLKKIYFTYQKSNKAKFSPYTFTYSSSNPSYNIKGYDRWGYYKSNTNADCDPLGSGSIPTAEFPYVEQGSQIDADGNASSWNLSTINLPSGGKIQVTYESDDYAYVQNKQAMQMFKWVGTGDYDDGTGVVTGPVSATLQQISDPSGEKNKALFFDLVPGHTTNINEYFNGINELYFRSLVRVTNTPARYEYVSGYAKIRNKGIHNGQGWVVLEPVKLNDNGFADYNPITKAAIQFLRLNKPQWAWGSEISGEPSFGKDLLEAMINSNFVRNIAQAIDGPNKAIYDNGSNCQYAVVGRSWFRLNNVAKKKFGGGARVKKIEMSDEWSGMTGSQESTFSYGQEYKYTLDDGTSSGVASYEPQLGGDENPWKQPVYFDEEKLLAPDDEHYMEEPFGEMFFPSANVGYSRVTVTNLQYANVKRHATGRVVHQFYTAKDYPTITERTDVEHKQEKDNPWSLTSLFHIDVKDYMTATQGYVIELNDMHGKPWKQEVYPEAPANSTTDPEPISSVEYKYKNTPYLNGSLRLDNTVTVIKNDGTVSTAQVGVYFDMVADMREHWSCTNSTSVNGNLDVFLFPGVPPVPVPVPIILPSQSKEQTRFRSAVNTKVIQRFAILEETIAKDLGATASTKNLAYDAETGEALLTQTTTNFNDNIYSFTYPAHWYYDGMGPAYRNVGFVKQGLNFSSGSVTITNAPAYFSEGDELGLSSGSNYSNAWVTEVTPNSIKAVDKVGSLVSGTWNVKVIKSGRRNMIGTPMASITTMANPLDNLQGNIFEKVLQASATEFANNWRTYCDCFTSPATYYTTNPFVLGIKGSWKPKRSFLHLSERTQSNYNNNTNIRQDGVFRSFTPFYTLTNGKWTKDERNWTYTSEVTEFSPYGPELENKDALGRFSAATFGYSQSFATSVAANSRYRDIGNDNFEDYGFSPCGDNHFKFNNPSQVLLNNIVTTTSHTGRKSIKVASGTPVNMTRQLTVCAPEGCSIDLTGTANGTSYNIIASGGTAPYIIEWNILDGTPDVQLYGSGNGVTIVNSYGTVEITMTDSKGCKVTEIFVWTP